VSDLKFYNGKIENPFRPFSNGTDAMIWEGNNCDRCTKAWHSNGNWPKEETIKQYVRCGKYCRLQYWIHIGWIEGTIPKEIAEQIGIQEDGRIMRQCKHFSDNDDDGYKPPKKIPPDNTPGNQLTMPFIFEELNIKEPEIITT
jgi:hypothetical protein